MMLVWPALSSTIEGGALIVRGGVQPSPLTASYRIKVTYRDGFAPRAEIVTPKLIRRPDAPNTPIPHTYNFTKIGEERPCLYYPRADEWTAAKSIATTIMPWLLTWLLDYEIWLATGEWLGGGASHGSRKDVEEPGAAA
jgi:hypothetical protein